MHAARDLKPVADDIDPPSYALSVLAMTGLTAHAGMIWQAGVRDGERVVIPAVTGDVGSVAAQLCAARDARVIGIAGSGEKCRYAVDSLGAAHCIVRRGEDVEARLGELCPDGINVYFDLVGGPILHAACRHLAHYGRVVLCGLMAEYNRANRSPGFSPGQLIGKRAVVSGLVVYDYEPRRDEYIRECTAAAGAGQALPARGRDRRPGERDGRLPPPHERAELRQGDPEGLMDGVVEGRLRQIVQ